MESDTEDPSLVFAKLSQAPAKLAELVLFPAYPTNPPTTHPGKV